MTGPLDAPPPPGGDGGTPSSDDDDDVRYMQEALVEARAAEAHDDVPVGAVVVKDGRVIARAAATDARSTATRPLTPRSWRCAPQPAQWASGAWTAAPST